MERRSSAPARPETGHHQLDRRVASWTTGAGPRSSTWSPTTATPTRATRSLPRARLRPRPDAVAEPAAAVAADGAGARTRSTGAPTTRRRRPARWPRSACRRSRGARTRVLFFQWRQAAAGAEKFHSAMLPHCGSASAYVPRGGPARRRARRDDRPAGARGEARVAIVLDWDNWWAIDQPDHPAQFDYLAHVQGWHAALARRNVQVDLVRPGGPFDRLRARRGAEPLPVAGGRRRPR